MRVRSAREKSVCHPFGRSRHPPLPRRCFNDRARVFPLARITLKSHRRFVSEEAGCHPMCAHITRAPHTLDFVVAQQRLHAPHKVRFILPYTLHSFFPASLIKLRAKSRVYSAAASAQGDSSGPMFFSTHVRNAESNSSRFCGPHVPWKVDPSSQ